MGEELMVSCTVDGNPAPTVTWWFNETMLDTTPSRITAGMNGNVATLTITSLMGNDTGNYTCRASNGVGSPAVSEPLALTVQGVCVCVCVCVCVTSSSSSSSPS